MASLWKLLQLVCDNQLTELVFTVPSLRCRLDEVAFGKPSVNSTAQHFRNVTLERQLMIFSDGSTINRESSTKSWMNNLPLNTITKRHSTYKITNSRNSVYPFQKRRRFGNHSA